MSMSPVERGRPWDASAKAPTTMKSAPARLNADNMSLKSGFSIEVFFKGPGIKSELIYHLKQLSRRLIFQIVSRVGFL